MNWIGDSADAIKDNANNIQVDTNWCFRFRCRIHCNQRPRVIGRYRLLVDAAKGAVSMAGTAIKIGADAIMVIPNAISRK